MARGSAGSVRGQRLKVCGETSERGTYFLLTLLFSDEISLDAASPEGGEGVSASDFGRTEAMGADGAGKGMGQGKRRTDEQGGSRDPVEAAVGVRGDFERLCLFARVCTTWRAASPSSGCQCAVSRSSTHLPATSLPLPSRGNHAPHRPPRTGISR